jgi:eukaryotic-like serine/threonine-protein kinase
VTSRYYGESEELLNQYAAFDELSDMSTSAAGTFKPNDLGLFDMHGSVRNWCQERYQEYALMKNGECAEDIEDVRVQVRENDRRVLRGGSFLFEADKVRCAHRMQAVPLSSEIDIGFRVARTIR